MVIMNKIKTRYYIANWKMYQSFASIKKFLSMCKRDQTFIGQNSNKYIGIAASYEHLYFVHKKLNKMGLHCGSQDCSHFVQGAYTGQFSVRSLQEMKLSFAIIGHSETRLYGGQSDAMIASKLKLLLAANISPILCVGETLTQKQGGLTLQSLYDQLEAALIFLQSYSGDAKIFIAYEPMYAIGTGIIPSRQDLEQVFYFLKNLVKEVPVAKNVMFLYGGSVSSETLPQFENIHEISGFLIGKASIDFQELKKIVQSDGRVI